MACVADGDNDSNAETGLEKEEAYGGLGHGLPGQDEGGDSEGHDCGVDQGEGHQP